MTPNQDLQVVILCGGMGTRIRDVTDDIPKPMIPIGGKPIVWHVMQGYARHGFRRFILCLGYKGWSIKQFFLDYHLAHGDLSVHLGRHNSVKVMSRPDCDDWEVTLAETGEDTMTGGRVKSVERFLDGDHFLLTYGDGVSDVDITRLMEFHRQQGRLGTVTAVHSPGRFGEMDLSGPEVTQFAEKPAVTPGWISGGFFVFRREFLKRLSGDPSQILERGPLMDLAADGELAAYRHEGFWQCMDTSRDYQYLNQLWSEGKAKWLPPATRREVLPSAA
jgi:glucose-1-phosphate cytidylyltransferase